MTSIMGDSVHKRLSHASSEFDPTSLLSSHGAQHHDDATSHGAQHHDDVTCNLPKLPVPPDGGWGWVVVFCSFMTSIIYAGLMYSFGVFIDDYAETFQVSRSLAALLGSIFTGIFSMSAPLACALINNFGFRWITVIGGVMTCVSFFAAAWCKNYILFMILYSVLGSDYPSTIAVNYYFERKRAFANGISAAGVGLGAFTLVPISYILIENFGWRGSMMILAGIGLNSCVFGMPLMMPLPTATVEPQQTLHRELSKISDDDHPVFDQGVSSPIASAQSRLVSKVSGSPLARVALLRAASRVAASDSPLKPENQTTVEELFHDSPLRTITSTRHRESSRIFSDSDRLQVRQPVRLHSRISVRSYAEAVLEPLPELQASLIAAIDPSDCSRPMNRDDILYDANLQALPEFAESNRNFELYRQNTVTIPQLVTIDPKTSEVVGVEEEPKTLCQKWIPHAVRDVLRQTFDFSLFSDPAFVVFTAFLACGSLTDMIPTMFIANRAVTDYGMSAVRASFLISIIGASNTVGRVFAGIVADRICKRPLMIATFGLLIIGIATLLVPLCTDFTSMTIYAIVFGVFLAAYTSLTSVILVEFWGLDRLTNAYGLSLLPKGAFSMIGPPIGAFLVMTFVFFLVLGLLYDRTNSYDATFIYAGIVLLCGVLFGLMMPFAPRKWHNSQSKELAALNESV